ncbi:MAG: hypothetical protein CL944_00475 [Candidatus Diapherotrites archaeon]|uniref:Uncharacterized protein n=1 Tax=Candidatus Iainarchaeum sp. TaxID=3101447 RepID=A0A2D6LP08_9ARCH|nr:hypothetical protein [Candidatus Diapherotrites archaeon]|tara:strand:+ start:4520 stop:4837 length:318 start_codon:yes stop_codon:yes gene_type:complete
MAKELHELTFQELIIIKARLLKQKYELEYGTNLTPKTKNQQLLLKDPKKWAAQELKAKQYQNPSARVKRNMIEGIKRLRTTIRNTQQAKRAALKPIQKRPKPRRR